MCWSLWTSSHGLNLDVHVEVEEAIDKTEAMQPSHPDCCRIHNCWSTKQEERGRELTVDKPKKFKSESYHYSATLYSYCRLYGQACNIHGGADSLYVLVQLKSRHCQQVASPLLFFNLTLQNIQKRLKKENALGAVEKKTISNQPTSKAYIFHVLLIHTWILRASEPYKPIIFDKKNANTAFGRETNKSSFVGLREHSSRMADCCIVHSL